MNPYGTDRVRPGKEGQWVIACRHAKGWRARTEKTLTTVQHPGTAVLWDGEYYEVVSATAGPGGIFRYVLEPWRDEHAIRITDAYDDESEARREEEHQKAEAREKGRVAANVFGVFTGNLPAVVQEHLGSEIGISPARLTVLSFLLPLAIEAFAAFRLTGHILDPNRPPIPLVIALLAVYLAFETLVRIHLVWSLNRPVGSAFGYLGYAIYWLVAGRARHALSPFAEPKGAAVVIPDAPVDVALRDAFTLREPLLTLLTPREQEFLAIRFGFDYRKHSVAVIAVILLLTGAGMFTSIMSLESRGPNLSAFSSLILAAAIAAEQVYRLTALKRGPAGSFLAAVIRPFVAKLFAS